MPGSSVAHLRIPALTPVSAMPSSMSLTNISVMISGPPSMPARALVVKPERHVVIGVKPGRHNDIQAGGRRDAGNARDIAAQADHREVDDGVHAAGLQLVEPGDGIGHSLFFVAPGVGVVLGNFGGHDEYVLVHERHAEISGIDGSTRGIEFGHVADARPGRWSSNRGSRDNMNFRWQPSDDAQVAVIGVPSAASVLPPFDRSPPCCSIPINCNAVTQTIGRGRSWPPPWTSSSPGARPG